MGDEDGEEGGVRQAFSKKSSPDDNMDDLISNLVGCNRVIG